MGNKLKNIIFAMLFLYIVYGLVNWTFDYNEFKEYDKGSINAFAIMYIIRIIGIKEKPKSTPPDFHPSTLK